MVQQQRPSVLRWEGVAVPGLPGSIACCFVWRERDVHDCCCCFSCMHASLPATAGSCRQPVAAAAFEMVFHVRWRSVAQREPVWMNAGDRDLAADPTGAV